jgi:signal-transduction protein with cAMP-binding, CBS, and nucleotidyltransferase domain
MGKRFPSIIDKDQPIRAFITKKLIGTDISSTVQDAARKMTEFNISSIVILEDNKVVGFFTESDLKRKIVAVGKTPDTSVKDIMIKDLITIDISSTVSDAMKTMMDNDIKHLLIKEKGEIIGIMSFTDFLTMERQKLETFIARE